MQGHIVSQLNNWSLWAEVNPAKCPCSGSGWLLSDYDTWHRCGLHSEGVPHPEAEDDSPRDPWRMLRLRRAAYRTFLDASGLSPEEFRTACVKLMGREARDEQEWVDAAEQVTSNIHYEAREKEAREKGFSCDLERRWAEEAQWEAMHGPGY